MMNKDELDIALSEAFGVNVDHADAVPAAAMLEKAGHDALRVVMAEIFAVAANFDDGEDGDYAFLAGVFFGIGWAVKAAHERATDLGI